MERVFEALVSLGLSETESRVYMFLALKGPKITRTIIDDLKISNQQIIQSLKKLQSLGVVEVIDTQKGYSALPFEKALALLIKTEKEKNKMMQESLLLNWKAMLKKNFEI